MHIILSKPSRSACAVWFKCVLINRFPIGCMDKYGNLACIIYSCEWPNVYGPYPQWQFVTSQNKDACDSLGTFVRFVWTIMEKDVSDHILAKKEGIEF